MRRGISAQYGVYAMSNTEPPSRQPTPHVTPLVKLATAPV